ncbi:hypothetical protein Taro_056655 [Colocasia esculenta]|uniref:Uncharacterized protein n=1 Tax=Colocasia esculenta TaxID=4460 RepID=A0A843XUK5_COLES|nr:hypothetical protein [Colocasia esculenta]
MWRSSWWLESRRSSIPSSPFCPVHLLRPARTTFLKPNKGSGADPVNATARCVAFRGLVATALTCRDLIATRPLSRSCCLNLTAQSRSSQPPVAF